MKFSGSKESVRGSMVNAGIPAALRKTAPELFDSLVNNPLRVNATVPHRTPTGRGTARTSGGAE